LKSADFKNVGQNWMLVVRVAENVMDCPNNSSNVPRTVLLSDLNAIMVVALVGKNVYIQGEVIAILFGNNNLCKKINPLKRKNLLHQNFG
jgi:hypothetical protein